MGNLASTQLNTQSDPAVVLQQALQRREQQYAAIQNPQQQLAARLGGLLGGGLVNVAQDRGFFDVNDPLLAKVSQIQGVYNDVASRIDPASDPAKFYSELQKAYSDAGLGREALAAAQEAQKAKTSGIDFQLKETQLFEKNPELLAGRITSALEAGNEAEANRLANLNARLIEDRDLTRKAKETEISSKQADIAYKKALTEDGKYKVEWNENLQRYVRTDKLGNVEVVPLSESMKELLSGSKDTKDKKGKPEGKLDPNKYMVGGNTPAAAPSAAPAAPVASAPTDMSAPNPAAYNQNAGTYRLDADPIIKMISDYAGQNRQLLETNPEFRNSITVAYENRKQELARLMGSGVRFQ